MSETVEWGIHYPGEPDPHPAESEWRARSWARYWNEHRSDEGEALAVSRVVVKSEWAAATNPPPDNRDPAGCASEESADVR